MGIWLASASERRSQIIHDMFGQVTVKGLEGIDETPPFGLVSHQVLEICKRKANAIGVEHGYQFVLVADTMIEDPDDFNSSLGKAHDEFEATSMLLRLSGRRHKVWSATGVQVAGDWTFFIEYAIVEFQELNSDDIELLIKSNSWVGKAGSYDLAGMASKHTKLIDGDELTVLGFAPSALRLIGLE
ncbi:MAG: Maf family protein [Euryarchaeota archaeon]